MKNVLTTRNDSAAKFTFAKVRREKGLQKNRDLEQTMQENESGGSLKSAYRAPQPRAKASAEDLPTLRPGEGGPKKGNHFQNRSQSLA